MNCKRSGRELYEKRSYFVREAVMICKRSGHEL